MWHSDALLPQGLFSCRHPGANVYCKSVFYPRSFAKQSLTTTKLLRLYQIPLEMDRSILEMAQLTGFMEKSLKSQLKPMRTQVYLPFEDTPPPEMYASIFRQLWSENKGGDE